MGGWVMKSFPISWRKRPVAQMLIALLWKSYILWRSGKLLFVLVNESWITMLVKRDTGTVMWFRNILSYISTSPTFTLHGKCICWLKLPHLGHMNLLYSRRRICSYFIYLMNVQDTSQDVSIILWSTSMTLSVRAMSFFRARLPASFSPACQASTGCQRKRPVVLKGRTCFLIKWYDYITLNLQLWLSKEAQHLSTGLRSLWYVW